MGLDDIVVIVNTVFAQVASDLLRRLRVPSCKLSGRRERYRGIQIKTNLDHFFF